MHPDHLDDLQRHRGYPSVSILLATTPGQRLAVADGDRLQRLLGAAERRLTGDVPDHVRAGVMTSLAEQARTVADGPVLRAVALFAAPGRSASHVLAVSLRERVVVDDTFATRDLVHHVRRTVPVVVVTVSEQRVRLLDGTVDVLRERTTPPFPLVREEGESDAAWGRRTLLALDALGMPGGPLVVAGVERTARWYTSRLSQPVAGVVRGGHDRTRAADLRDLARIHVEAWLRGRELMALEHLDMAAGQALVATDLAEVWDAAFGGQVALLAVERGYAVPVRVRAGRPSPVPPEETEAPDVVDDAVDDLIEAVRLRGGEAVLVGDGALGRFGRMAAVLRY